MSVEKLEFLIHFLCPYSQRVLYAAAFKGIESTITEVDLANKADWLLEVNPLGSAPAAKAHLADGRTYNLTESTTITHYLDSFPGKSMFPAEADGSVLPVTRAVCDGRIHLYAGRFGLAYNFYMNEATAEHVQKFKDILREINTRLSSGFFMDDVFGRSEITFTDIMLLPHLERFVAYQDGPLSPVWEGEDFSNILRWYNRIFEEPWAQKYKANVQQLKVIAQLQQAGQWKGLKLPASKQDSVEAYLS
mmetsp:Transcript_21268/g.39160  ORF Transcript_21268/g.39160 Transcript_21268/m.39160 type:complete len:248 (-) Transcript_21268:789-1532(-)